MVLFGRTVPAFALKATKACHIATVYRVYNSRHREYEGRVLPPTFGWCMMLVDLHSVAVRQGRFCVNEASNGPIVHR